MSITDELAGLFRAALASAIDEGAIEGPVPDPEFERPKRREHGDWATNVALAAAKGKPPREIAQGIVDRLPTSDLIARVEIAGPGFINLHLAPAWLHDIVRRAADPSGDFGRSKIGGGKKINVEYVSANPTGPINVVSGRHAATGDAIASLFDAVGYDVTREFYVNDAGRQIELFGGSIAARYLQHFGRDAVIPEDGYQGDYVKDLAAEIAEGVGDRYLDAPESERVGVMLEAGLARMREQIRKTLERFGTTFDVWFSERKLHEANAIEAGIARMRERGFVYERDGAVWLASSRLGDDKDRVLIRANGEPTYLASDVAYLTDKFARGFEHVLYQWGADHHGTVARLLAAAEALGFDRAKVEVRLVQVVSLMSGSESLKGSKRAGVVVALDDLIDEVGADAARYTFLTRSIDAPLEFDIALVKEQAPENPVFYVQYAHARICSIIRKASGEGIEADPKTAQLERLEHPSEDALMRKLAAYEEEIVVAAEMRAPQRITRYVEELAATFSAFYRDCKVVSDDRELTGARLSLCIATRAVIADALMLLGVTAPERM